MRPPAASLDDGPAGSRELIDRLDGMQPQDVDFDVCVLQLAAGLLLNLDPEQLKRTADVATHRAKHEKSGDAFAQAGWVLDAALAGLLWQGSALAA